ncbi:MAG: SAM-dependent DNA methyltransferase, partial [Treponema sp.]|nr:SAM-dependent DNA methyltransferase [Treponema sp.]
MITGEIKNKIDNIWQKLWAAGMANPLTCIEQLSYLMFIRSLDDIEIESEQKENMMGIKSDHIFNKSQQKLRWSKFKNLSPDEIFSLMKDEKNGIFAFIKNLRGDKESAFAKFMKDASFQIPAPQVLVSIIAGLDELYENDIQEQDMLGDIYEYMLDKLSASGQNGQFRTPTQIRNLMVNLIQPSPDDCICDPACGTAGFLISSANYVREHNANKMTDKQWDHYMKGLVTGYDTDMTMLRISAMNLMLHSITNPTVEYQDGVSKANQIEGAFDIILANPPFTGTVNESTINPDLLDVCKTKKTELLFVALFIRMLKKGGRCACIVPDGVLFGSSNAHKALRKELVENHQLQAVISMPSGVFKPYAGVSTGILVFTKTGAGGTNDVWFYDMKADGFSLDDKRQPVEQNDIPDIIKRFKNLGAEKKRSRTDQSFFVPKSEIVANNYDLSINKYKEVEYEKVEYPPTSEILADIEKLDKEVADNLAELKKLLTETNSNL